MAKKSLFIQVAWNNPTTLKANLEHVRRFHKDKTKEDYIYNVVLDEIGNGYRLYTEHLDIIAPYITDGPKKTFDNVFLGSHYVPWQGQGNSYYEGMQNSTHRWANLGAQKAMWEQFVLRYPKVYFHFYINHEGVLDYFDHEPTRAGYAAFLLQSVRDSHDVAPRRAVLWSPAVWSGRPLTTTEESAISKTFNSVRDHAQRYGHHAGVNWMHFQDMMGRGRLDITKEDVYQWHQELKATYNWASLAVDMELFTTDSNGNLTPESRTVLAAREKWYRSKGMNVGASWELRWWAQNHVEL
jgi:hypothetical protein